MTPILLYLHGGSLNHGCEAIVRSTAKILKRSPSSMTLYSLKPQDDLLVGLDRVVTVADHQYNDSLTRWQWLVTAIHHKFTKNDNRFYRYKNRTLADAVRPGSLALSIGGDNYCYGGLDWIYVMNRLLQENGARTVLWGCSVEPKEMDHVMVDDLRRHSLITARESITFEGMQEKGLTQAVLYPDPAFQLDKVMLPLPPGFEEGNTIGLNVSPLIMKKEGRKGATFEAAVALIKHILKTTTSSVALIPHVIWPSNNDLEPLGELYAAFKDTGRVILMGDHNCMELKGFISRCRMFIGARTHATIAAYSSQVPTLVIGYSVKARGIARDIFGDEKDLVLPVQELMEAEQLIVSFEKLREREDDLRRHLTAFMPEYAARAAEAKLVITDLCK